ncbi:hypothetical protein PENSPDRAFT_620949 [Peniophora sp. CONT]|nr:hypothetical protein PENSPDRAFT_620949 [Peniophora sp. CONT]
MSLSDLTRNSFQSGISPAKWSSLCRLYLAKRVDITEQLDGPERAIANSVLVLYGLYPGDVVLQSYLKEAIQSELLSLPVFLSTFLYTARAQELNYAPTLDMLCRLALELHYSTPTSATAPVNPLFSPADSSNTVLSTVADAINLLRTTYTLPMNNFHRLPESASELVSLLLNSLPALTDVSSAVALTCIDEAKSVLQVFRLMPNAQQALEGIVLTLSLFTDDDPAMLRESQMLNAMQSSVGKGDLLRSGNANDIVACQLLLGRLVQGSSKDWTAGDDNRAAAMIMSAYGITGWALNKFYAQLLIASLSWLVTYSESKLWRAFILGRLPRLLVLHNKAMEQEGMAHELVSAAARDAWGSLCLGQPHSFLLQLDQAASLNMMDTSSDSSVTPPSSFMRDFTYQLQTFGLVDEAFLARVAAPDPTPPWARIAAEARDANLDPATYIGHKVSQDGNSEEDVAAFVTKLVADYSAHHEFAEIVKTRFVASATNMDVETLSQFARIFTSDVKILDVFRLHLPLPEILARGLAVFEDYDCETVGDPQTAVRSLGELVTFLQVAICRYGLYDHPFTLGTRKLSYRRLQQSFIIHLPQSLAQHPERMKAIQLWYSTLFNANSEGIDDDILRQTRPAVLLDLAATLVVTGIQGSMRNNASADSLNNGLAYMLDPLLNWTLLGTVQYLLRDLRISKFQFLLHARTFYTLVMAETFPQPLLALAAPEILRVINDPNMKRHMPKAIDWQAMRTKAHAALGLPTDGTSHSGASLQLQAVDAVWNDQPLIAIRDALTALGAGKPPSLDVSRCLLFLSPIKFLHLFWAQLQLAVDMDGARALAVHVLSHARPPLLPVFLRAVFPALLDTADSSPGTMSAELLAGAVATAIMHALQLERAIAAVGGDQRPPLGEPSTSMARALANDLRHRKASASAKTVAQRLASSATFVGSFPVFKTEI